MNLTKSLDYFNPHDVKQPIHIIGVGSVGSCVAELLARYGFTKIHIYDDDVVEEKNIVNQMFFLNDVGKRKTDAVERLLKNINRDISVTKHRLWSKDDYLSGYVFMCVDSVNTRKDIIKSTKFQPEVELLIDVRTRLEDAQVYCVKNDNEALKSLNKTLDFTQEEAVEATPTSACGEILGVASTVREASSAAVCELVNYILHGAIQFTVSVSPFHFNEWCV